jgi:DNA modification methylase
MIELLNKDCMEVMSQYPDKYFDLAIVDPPYGIGFGDYERGSSGIKVKERYTKNEKKKWDCNIPSDEYFNELFRVSKNQVICGGNYFNLPPTQGFVFWYKKNPVPNFADGEYIWTSFQTPARCFEYMYYGNINTEKNRTHPTQKPIQLYKWLLKNYAKPTDKIIDTHLGSGSSAIAAYDFGCAEFVGTEIDKEYFDAAVKRFEIHKLQQTIIFEK